MTLSITQRLNRLLDALAVKGIAIDRAPLGGDGGGLAVVAGNARLFVDTMADPATAYETTLAAVAELPDLSLDELPEEIRNDIARVRGNV